MVIIKTNEEMTEGIIVIPFESVLMSSEVKEKQRWKKKKKNNDLN